MKSCHAFSILVILCAGLVVGCVPYQTHENLAFEYAKTRKTLDDLRSKYNRLLAEGGGASAERIRFLQDELDSKARLIAELETELSEVKSSPFDINDQARVPDLELGPRGQLILGDLLFKSGSADIGAKGRAALDDLAHLLKTKYPGESFHLVGHTDNVPIKKSPFDSNLDLGHKRAHMVFKYLMQEHGFTESQFLMTSYGPNKPKVANDSPENRALNRRVEVFRIASKF